MGRKPLERIPSYLRDMPSYEPVEPVDVLAKRLGITEEQVIKLDANENPYGPSPRVIEALSNFRYYHIYPDPEHREVRQAIGKLLGLNDEYIVFGSGADEILDLVGRMFIQPGRTGASAPPTFGMYPFITNLYGGRYLAVPRNEDFSLDLAAMEEAARQGVEVFFLASPNNPTGNPVSKVELDRLLDTGSIIVIDEAYVEFGGESVAQLVPERDNLIVVRTFSKWAGLAGIRVGYGVFPQELAELARKIKMPYNLNAAAQVAVLASLADMETLQQRVKAIVEERQRLFSGLSALRWLRPWPSETNFLLCAVEGIEAKEVWAKLRERGIIVRYFETPQLRHCLRFTIGKPEHTERLLAALREIGEETSG
ncbi:MAG TPA: histidinol-phosphate transaminase [Dehalococcoidia bacterium]|nr:histidinol-phosphate transaminase [Dehalococcoidia bacterium]